MTKPARTHRKDYRHFTDITTRWMDNDIYGHVNNVVYYSWFDTAVNEYLIKAGALDLQAGEVVGLVVETGCSYFASVAFPDRIEAGIRVTKLGTSSVRYEVGIFRENEDEAAAQGYFVHVYVTRKDNRPTPLPDSLRQSLRPIIL